MFQSDHRLGTHMKQYEFRHPHGRVAVALLAVLLFGAELSTGQSKTGTTVGSFLLIEPSARLTAMGNAGAATYEEVQAGYYNPGAYGHLNRSDAQFTHSLWLAGISYNHAAVAVKTGENGTFALTLTSLNSGDIAVRTVQQPLGTGEQYSVTNTAIGLAYGHRLTDRFSAGIQVNYVSETIWHSSMSAVAVNFGTLYQLSPDGFHIGASISNFGTRGRYEGTDLRIRFDNDPEQHGDNSNLPGEVYTEEFGLPIIFRVGLAYPLQLDESNRILMLVDAFHPNNNTESVSFGIEWKMFQLFSLRGGYQRLFQKDSEIGWTFGGGIEYEVFTLPLHLDYAWADHGLLNDTQRLTIGFRF